MSSSAQQEQPIVLDVLRISSTDVLGETKPLSVATPFSFSNAKGALKDVDSYAQIEKIAAESAASFKKNLNAKH